MTGARSCVLGGGMAMPRGRAHITHRGCLLPVIGAQVPEDCICPLTLEVMRDPVIDALGHSYEVRASPARGAPAPALTPARRAQRYAIEAWLQTHSSSPRTNEELSHKHLIPNLTLRSVIRALLK